MRRAWKQMSHLLKPWAPALPSTPSQPLLSASVRTSPEPEAGEAWILLTLPFHLRQQKAELRVDLNPRPELMES